MFSDLLSPYDADYPGNTSEKRLMMRIVIGGDHAAPALKSHVKQHLEAQGHEVNDVGTNSNDSVDYPDFAETAARIVVAGEADLGILICGSGVGIGIAANKVHGIRCVICSEPYSARMARQHNNANMISLGARLVGPDMALMIVDEFVNGQFDGDRHARRVGKIQALDDAR